MVARNDITGDPIRSKVGNSSAYTESWERIFGAKAKELAAKQEPLRTEFEKVLHDNLDSLLETEPAYETKAREDVERYMEETYSDTLCTDDHGLPSIAEK